MKKKVNLDCFWAEKRNIVSIKIYLQKHNNYILII